MTLKHFSTKPEDLESVMEEIVKIEPSGETVASYINFILSDSIHQKPEPDFNGFFMEGDKRRDILPRVFVVSKSLEFDYDIPFCIGQFGINHQLRDLVVNPQNNFAFLIKSDRYFFAFNLPSSALDQINTRSPIKSPEKGSFSQNIFLAYCKAAFLVADFDQLCSKGQIKTSYGTITLNYYRKDDPAENPPFRCSIDCYILPCFKLRGERYSNPKFVVDDDTVRITNLNRSLITLKQDDGRIVYGCDDYGNLLEKHLLIKK